MEKRRTASGCNTIAFTKKNSREGRKKMMERGGQRVQYNRFYKYNLKEGREGGVPCYCVCITAVL